MPESTERAFGCRRDGFFFAAQAGPFALPGDRPQYARDRVADIRHVRIDISLDMDERRIAGSVTHAFAPINNGLQSLDLDVLGLEVKGVRLGGGRALGYRVEGGRLKVDLGKPRSAGEEVSVTVDFAGSPRRGLYFVHPDEAYPAKRVEAWTQGQDQDSRHWFPCYDYPNEMATSEMHVSLKEPYSVVSNGELTGVEPGPLSGWRTFHWRQDVPHVTYLTSICAGQFGEVRDEWDGIPVTYHVPPGREDDAREVFKTTPEMLNLFSQVTGCRYPYAKYAQVVVQDFIFGGMENVSATTLTDLILYDPRARIDQDADYIISHELAHQWFGDLLTCRDWSHGWLNEGFATFMELVWTEHHKGVDEYRREVLENVDLYLQEAGGRYRRPIVTNVYANPIDLFDRHLYEKGSLVLNMLRHLLGDDLFWKSIRHYVSVNRSRSVTTPDLQKSIEEATGRNLDWFFDQWVYGGGHPDLKAEYAWDDSTKTARVSFKQTQEGDQVAKTFRLPLNIDFTPDAGERQSFHVEMTEREQAFYFSLAARPKLVRIDPGGQVLKTIDFQRPPEMLREQLANDDDVLGRIDAARALGKKGDADSIAALGRAARDDSFWAVQAEAAKALGATRSNAAMEELLQSVGVEHPKARRAVVAALGEFRDDRAAQALERVIDQGDASYYVEAAAASAIGKTRQERAFAALERSLAKESQNEVIRQNALTGLGELKDERGVPVVIEWSQYGRPPMARPAANTALARLGEVVKDNLRTEIIDHLVRLLEDPWLRSQLSAIDALKDLKADEALPHLDRTAQRALDGRVIRMAREAAQAIRTGKDKGDEVKKLREEVDKLVDENRGLRDRLDKIEARLKPAEDQTSP